MDWNNEKILKFISAYETEPILWNPREVGHKRKDLTYDGWRRIKSNLGWDCTIDDLKKKRDSLMAYYRQHLHKLKKKSISDTGTDDVFNAQWFAFGPLHSFLQTVYDCKPSSKQVTENDEAEENTSTYTDRSDDDNKRPKRTHGISAEIMAATQHMNEALNHVRSTYDNDEYELFGKLIASKLRKIQNSNIKEILMNDIHNLVFKASMLDRINHPTAQLPQSFIQTMIDQHSSQLSQSSTSSPHQPHQSPQSPYNHSYQSPQS